MAELYRFFDPALDENGLPDREYNAQEFTDYFKALVTTGVMKGAGNELKVVANGSNMISTVDTGIAFILGRYYENNSILSHTHETESLGRDRIDRIVIRMDLNTESRYVKSFVLKGVPSTNPVAPVLTQTPSVYEIAVAQVRVVGGQTYISATAVTDLRGTDVICPWAGSRILPNFDDVALNDLMASIGKANGIATLGPTGKVPQSQLDIKPPVDATTSTKGIVMLSNAITSIDTNQAATPYAVKQVNDKLNSDITGIGKGVFVFNPNTVAIGNNSEAFYDGSIALGSYARAHGINTVVIGKGTTATGNNMGKLGPDHLSSLSDRITMWQMNGNFYIGDGTKNFVMQHPNPTKKDTHLLRHAAVESPTAGDNLYRFTIEAYEDMQTVDCNLPDYFMYLNKDVDVHVSPLNHFGVAFGVTEGNILKVTCQKAGTYKVLVIGTRDDDVVQGWDDIGAVRDLGLTWEGETAVIEDAEIVTEKEIIEER